MAKKKNGQNLSNDPEKAIEKKNNNGNKANDKKNGEAAPEESHGGIMAIVIAAVAILVVGGSVGAFVLFLKAKQKYLDSLTQGKVENVSGGSAGTMGNAEDLGLNGTGFSDSGLDDTFGIGSTAMIPGATVPTSPEAPTTPQTPPYQPPYTPPYTPPQTPAADEEDQPEPERVRAYDFDSKLNAMDLNIMARFSDYDENQMSDARMGLSDN
jgi:hypothetical protein